MGLATLQLKPEKIWLRLHRSEESSSSVITVERRRKEEKIRKSENFLKRATQHVGPCERNKMNHRKTE